MVHEDHFANQAVACPPRLGTRPACPVGDDGAKQRRLEAKAQMARDRRENVAAMKRVAHFRTPETRLRQANDTRRLAAVRQPSPATVVRYEQPALADFDIEDRPIGTDAGIDHDDMQGRGWKVRQRRRKEKGGMANILRRDIVCQIDQPHRRIDGKQHTLERCHIRRRRAEIGGQGDKRIGHGSNPPAPSVALQSIARRAGKIEFTTLQDVPNRSNGKVVPMQVWSRRPWAILGLVLLVGAISYASVRDVGAILGDLPDTQGIANRAYYDHERFAGVKPLLPRAGVIGYREDEPARAAGVKPLLRFTQYVVGPVVLREDAEEPLVLIDGRAGVMPRPQFTGKPLHLLYDSGDGVRLFGVEEP